MFLEDKHAVDLLEARKKGMLYNDGDNSSCFNGESPRRFSSGLNSLGSDFDVFEANLEHRKSKRACTDGCDTLAKDLEEGDKKGLSIGETKFYSNEELQS